MFDEVIKKYVGSLVRHGLTAIAGSLVTIGINESQADSFVSASTPIVIGVGTYIVSQAWSFLQKKKAR